MLSRISIILLALLALIQGSVMMSMQHEIKDLRKDHNKLWWQVMQMDSNPMCCRSGASVIFTPENKVHGNYGIGSYDPRLEEVPHP